MYRESNRKNVAFWRSQIWTHIHDTNKGCVNHPLGAHEPPSIVQWGCPTMTHLGNWCPWYGAGYPSLGQTCVGALCSPSFSNQVAPSSILSNSLVTSCDLSSWNADAGGSAGIARSKEWPLLSRHEFSGVMKVGLLGSTCCFGQHQSATWPKKTWPCGSPKKLMW
jgi:hypothetical protein